MRVRLELFVEDMETSIGFYTRVLGFEVARNEPGDYASLRNGDVVFGIGPICKLPEGDGYFTRVNEWHRRVVASGHPVFEPPQKRPWSLRDFRIVDPDGYYLRLTSR